jgi:TorA maturation chaperone TorD
VGRSSEAGETRSQRMTRARVAASLVPAAPDGDRLVGDLIERASLLRTLAQAFGSPLDGRMVEVRHSLAQFSGRSDTNDRVARTGLSAGRAWQALSNDEIVAAYNALFLSPNGVPLREAAYVNGRLSGRAVQLADIEGLYRMYGFPFVETDAEPADHVSAELDFIGWLRMKEAYSRAHGFTAQARANEFGARVFVDQHLGCFVVALARRIRRSEQHAPYNALGSLLLAAIAREARTRGNH